MRFHLDPNRSVGSANRETIEPQCGYPSQLYAITDEYCVVQGGFPIPFKFWWDQMLRDRLSLLYLDLEFGLSNMHMRWSYAGKMQNLLLEVFRLPIGSSSIRFGGCRITNARRRTSTTIDPVRVGRIRHSILSKRDGKFSVMNESENNSQASDAYFGKCSLRESWGYLQETFRLQTFEISPPLYSEGESRFDHILLLDPLLPDLSSDPTGDSVE